MGIGRRLLDLARANLNALLDRAAGSGEVAKATDKDLEEELARRRERRLREDAERAQRIEAERAARQRAEERAASNGAANKAAPPPRGNNGARARTAPPKPPRNAEEKRLRELYSQLEVPFGSSFDEVKKSFRRLMRKYHPDLHLNDPKKHRAATQLTMTLTQAYRDLERHFEKR